MTREIYVVGTGVGVEEKSILLIEDDASVLFFNSPRNVL